MDISRYIINYSNEKDYDISCLNLQKVLYFIQAYFLITLDKPCFTEQIEAWNFGPVVRKAYLEWIRFGSCHIYPIREYFDTNGSANFWDWTVVKYKDEFIKPEHKKLINEVVDMLAPYSATALTTISCDQGPWNNVFRKYGINVIPNKVLKEYFQGKSLDEMLNTNVRQKTDSQQ